MDNSALSWWNVFLLNIVNQLLAKTTTRLLAVLQSPLVMVVAAMAFRFTVAIQWQSYVIIPQNDCWAFGGEMGKVAGSIAAGHGFASPLFGVSGPTAWVAPVYPYLLAGVFKLFGICSDSSALVALVLNVLFSSLTCLTIFYIGKESFGHSVAVLGGWIWAFSYTGIHFSRVVWETTLYTLLLSLVFLATLYLQRSTHVKHWIGFGILWGLVALTSPTALSMLPFVLGFLWYRIRERRAGCTVLLAAASLSLLLSVSPWLTRNYLTFGKFIFIRSTLGLELYVGNAESATGYFSRWLHPATNRPELQKYLEMGEMSYMAEKRRQALLFIVNHPLTFARLTVMRLVLWWTDPWPTEFLSWKEWAKFAYTLLLTSLAFLGLRIAISKRHAETLLFGTALVIFPLPYYVMHVSNRYRHPIEPIMVVLAAFALGWIFTRLPRLFSMVSIGLGKLALSIPVFLVAGVFLIPETASAQSALYRINAGGPSYTDSLGQLWSADQGFNTGNTFSTTSSILGTSDPTLFQTERWDLAANPELEYSLPLVNGFYRVNLLSADIYSGTQGVGLRVFDVVIEGTLVFNDLDIFAEAGGFTALTKTVDVQVADGVLNIQFLHGVENPKINALEVLDISTGPADTTPPVISNIATTGLTSSSATITWDTDEQADSEVEYGLDTNYGQSASDPALTTAHALGLSGLAPIPPTTSA